MAVCRKDSMRLKNSFVGLASFNGGTQNLYVTISDRL
jgi:hypothetical protein